MSSRQVKPPAGILSIVIPSLLTNQSRLSSGSFDDAISGRVTATQADPKLAALWVPLSDELQIPRRKYLTAMFPCRCDSHLINRNAPYAQDTDLTGTARHRLGHERARPMWTRSPCHVVDVSMKMVSWMGSGRSWQHVASQGSHHPNAPSQLPIADFHTPVHPRFCGVGRLPERPHGCILRRPRRRYYVRTFPEWRIGDC